MKFDQPFDAAMCALRYGEQVMREKMPGPIFMCSLSGYRRELAKISSIQDDPEATVSIDRVNVNRVIVQRSYNEHAIWTPTQADMLATDWAVLPPR